MTNDSGENDRGEISLRRRTVLSATSGIALGAALPTSVGASEQESNDVQDEVSSVRLTPRPAAADGGGTRSLNGTWDFALSTSETPPSSTGGRVAPDLSGTGNEGALSNDPAVVEDPSERALDLAGASHVAVGDADGVDFTEPGFTLQMTFRYEGDGPLWSKGGDQYSLGVWGGQLSFWMKGEGNWPGVDAGDLNQGAWYTTTVVVDESEIRLYVDAAEVGATEHDFSSLARVDSPLHLGSDGAPVVDSFRAFDAALSPDQIDREYDAPPDSAVAWLPINEVSDGMAPDESGNGNDGTLVNGPEIVPGRDGQGLDLAGEGHVSVADADSLDFAETGFALRATLRYDSGSGLVLDRGASPQSNGTEQFGLGIDEGTLSFSMQTDDGSSPDSLQTDVETGEWFTVTVVVDESDSRLFVDGEEVGSVAHGADGLASSDAPFVVGGTDLNVSVKSVAAFGEALSTDRIERGFRAMPDSAILLHNYRVIEDLSVEWRDEDVPGQWAYDEYYLPGGSADWYPSDGQLGWYRRSFEVPDGWDEGRLALRFDAVYSEAWVFVNGERVGHHVGGYTPFEIDVGDAVDPDGENTLAVAVSQQSEADDMGWQNVTGGITRGVTLFAVPDAHVADVDVRTDLVEGGAAATVSVETEVANAGPDAVEDATVAVSVAGPDGDSVGSAEREVDSVPAGESATVAVELSVDDPATWNPDQPRLHTVDVELDAGGTAERVRERIGIRDIAIDGNKLRLNGEAVKLRGVNWEEIHLAEHGHAVPPAITREDARRLKEANVNYVRAAHHPTSEAFLDACDELGIVVGMEAPLMFLGRGRGDPYPDVVTSQVLEMVERDKNRASVCIWSIANESEWYDVFETIGNVVAEVDPTRPTIFNHDNYQADDPWHDVYPLLAHHYPAFRTGSTVEEHANLDAPVLFDEAAHTYCYNDRELVTDPGLRDEWGRPFELIWDQCRAADAVAGAAIWAGGDHLEQWGEYLWGLLDRNRRPRPEYWHTKKVYSPVRVVDVEWIGNGNVARLTVENRHTFVDLAERDVEFEGTPGRGKGRGDLEVPPGERETVTLPVKGDQLEMTVTHPEGHTIEQAVFTPDSPSTDVPSEPADETFSENDGTVSVETDSFAMDVERASGAVEVRSSEGTPVVVDGPELALTPTQQETGRGYASAISHRPSGRSVSDVSLVEDDTAVSITVDYDDAEGTFLLRPLEDGIEVEYEFTLREAVDAREVGVTVPLARDLTTLSWTRDGQWSVYPDTHIGRPSGTAAAFPDGSRPDHEEIRIQQGQPWKDDATKFGSNDFRGTKRNVYQADLTAEDGAGLGLRSEGDQHVRAQVRSETVDLLALDRSLSGTNGDGWLSRHPVVDENPTLDVDETVAGSATLQVVAADDGSD
ncbi:glycoside hydrolase family 2 TIM barrel-domain containing protein [Halosimplex sp. TS25]|uniref:glycoside hydrolase family 2 TIM barrel-domain containing protein n=1 Tax=Halosimplex rarum TaxID=3396619 RepID=UPI0039ECE82B